MLRNAGREVGRTTGSAPGTDRTCDLRFRKPLLYPTELRERGRCEMWCVITHRSLRHQDDSVVGQPNGRNITPLVFFNLTAWKG